jgi:hypothetical protein
MRKFWYLQTPFGCVVRNLILELIAKLAGFCENITQNSMQIKKKSSPSRVEIMLNQYRHGA